uniref:C2H2-type domain-containing protein n=1 Tax=Romanomermis culicivorax TaxID=13658 RepID=A0A915LDP0_ROMCU
MNNNNDSFSQDIEMSADYTDNCLVIEEFTNGTNIEEADMLAQLECHEANDFQTKSRDSELNSLDSRNKNSHFTCPECDNAFVNEELLRRHRTDAHKRNLSVAEHLALSRGTVNKISKVLAPAKRLRDCFYCDCGEKFSSQTFLNLHKRKAHSVELSVIKAKNKENGQLLSVPKPTQVNKVPLKAAVKIKNSHTISGRLKAINLSKKMALANLTKKNIIYEHRNNARSSRRANVAKRGRPSFKIGALSCLLCDVVMSAQAHLCSHARLAHNEPAFVKRQYFSTVEQFRKWLVSVGESCFYKASTNKWKMTETVYYYCKKSFVVAKEGTFFNGKIVNFHCTAFIIARIFNEGAVNQKKVEVQFCASHSGNHDNFNCTYLSSNNSKFGQEVTLNEQKTLAKTQNATPSKNQNGMHRKSGATISPSSGVSEQRALKITPKTPKSQLVTSKTKKPSIKPKSNEKSVKNAMAANSAAESNDDDMVLSLAAKVGQKIFDVNSPTKNLSQRKQSSSAAKNLINQKVGEVSPPARQTDGELQETSKIDEYIGKLKSILAKLQQFNAAPHTNDKFLLSYIYFTIDSLMDICSKVDKKREYDEKLKSQTGTYLINGTCSNPTSDGPMAENLPSADSRLPMLYYKNTRSAPRKTHNSSKIIDNNDEGKFESPQPTMLESEKVHISTPSMAALMLELRQRVERIEKMQFGDDKKETGNEVVCKENSLTVVKVGRSQKRTIHNSDPANVENFNRAVKQRKLDLIESSVQKVVGKPERKIPPTSFKCAKKNTPPKSPTGLDEVELANIASKAEETLLKNGMRRISGMPNGKSIISPRKSSRINLAANKEYVQNKKEIPGLSKPKRTPKSSFSTPNLAKKSSPLKRVPLETVVTPRRSAAPVYASGRNAKPFLMKPARNGQQLQKVTTLPTISFENDEDNFVYDVSIEEENV